MNNMTLEEYLEKNAEHLEGVFEKHEIDWKNPGKYLDGILAELVEFDFPERKMALEYLVSIYSHDYDFFASDDVWNWLDEQEFDWNTKGDYKLTDRLINYAAFYRSEVEGMVKRLLDRGVRTDDRVVLDLIECHDCDRGDDDYSDILRMILGAGAEPCPEGLDLSADDLHPNVTAVLSENGWTFNE